MNPIQGKNAILSFYQDAFVPYVCASDISLAISTPSTPSRTRQDGPWKSYIYQSASYQITLSGVLVFDSSNFDGMEIVRNQMQLMYLPFRIAYTASDGSIQSFQGVCKIVNSSAGASMSDVVKGSYTLDGNGPLMLFDGLVPCPSAIVTITVTGTTDPAGNVVVNYTYTGAVAQVKYRVDGQGDYIYASAGMAIDVNGLVTESHSVEIIPICPNGYEGTGLIQDFPVTRGGTCGSVITNISIGVDYKASNTHTGPAPNMKYRIDGGAWIGPISINTVLNMASLSVGAHTLEEVPICTNGVEGTGFVKNFNVTSNPSQSIIDYDFTFNNDASTAMRIYVAGVVTVLGTSTASGSITVPVGVAIRFEVEVSGGDFGTLQVEDVTTSTLLSNQAGGSSSTLILFYNFTANGDEFLLTGVLDIP